MIEQQREILVKDHTGQLATLVPSRFLENLTNTPEASKLAFTCKGCTSKIQGHLELSRSKDTLGMNQHQQITSTCKNSFKDLQNADVGD